MAKTKCVVCNSFMGFDIGLGHHPNGNTDHRKTKDGKWACSEKCARDYNLALLNTGGNSGNFSSSSPTREIDHEAIASSRADEAAAKAEKARVDLEKEKHDDEMALKRRQQELEEKKNRQKRADELRAQGKTTQAFFVEHGTTVGIVVSILFVGLLVGYLMLNSKSNTKEGVEINLKLESIEDQVKIAIQEGNKEKALELANKLVHPLHEDDETKKFDAFNGYPKFDEEWNKKREKYKEEIMKLNGNSTTKIQEQAPVEETQPEQSTEILSQSESFDNSNLIGEWTGALGTDQLALTIETINADGSVTGFNIVKGNRRPLEGTVSKNGDDYSFELKEPGDDKWDGVFKFSITGSTAKGSWTSNNGKSTKQFSLIK
ncbi:MAG: hypothetical protein IPK03_06100 [Bacteroidetes bacterium]|nr:hypothetical protein [Bacteroidota bacterium]